MNRLFNIEEQIERAKIWIEEADRVVIGAGAGLSTAAGIKMSGKLFENSFKDFIDKYGITDLYSGGFYPYQTEEEEWAFRSRNALVCCNGRKAEKVYIKLLELVEEKDYFVITTNVDRQFEKAGFDKSRLFATQGDYGFIQCKNGCHQKIYDAEELFKKMVKMQVDTKIPSELVPRCPVCGGKMAMHLRVDSNFVQDEDWYKAAERYSNFINGCNNIKTVFLDLGTGFNTPSIIRFPFERFTYQMEKAKLIRINYGEADIREEIAKKSLGIDDDIAAVIEKL